MNARGLILISTAMALLVGCGGTEHARETPAAKAAVRVSTVEAARESWPSWMEAVGTVEARTEATIAAKTMGYVTAVKAREGDRVQAGQTLVEIAAQEVQSGVEQARAGRQEAQSAQAEVASAIAAAQAQATLAEATFRRMSNLHERKSISDQEFDEAKARYDAATAALKMAQAKQAQVGEKIRQAEAGVRAAEAQLSYLRVSAPFAGVVTARMVEPGNLASPGMPLLKIEQGGAYRLVAAFPESALPAVRPGTKVRVVIDALGMDTDATVAEVVPMVDPATRTFAVKVALPSAAGLRSGVFGKARLAGEAKPAVTVPAEAVRSNGQLMTVFVVEGNTARARLVKLGAEREGKVEVLSGLDGGERIVHPAPASLRDGDPVEAGQ